MKPKKLNIFNFFSVLYRQTFIIDLGQLLEFGSAINSVNFSA